MKDFRKEKLRELIINFEELLKTENPLSEVRQRAFQRIIDYVDDYADTAHNEGIAFASENQGGLP